MAFEYHQCIRYATSDVVSSCVEDSSIGCLTYVDRVLERVTRVVLNNPYATVSNASAQITGINAF